MKLVSVTVILMLTIQSIACGKIFEKSYDKDLALQCDVLMRAYPEPLTGEQVEKVRSIGKNPEKLRSYLLGLATAAMENASANLLENPKSVLGELERWAGPVNAYEEWQNPSARGRINFAKNRNHKFKHSNQLPNLGTEGPWLTDGPESTILILKSTTEYPTKDQLEKQILLLTSGIDKRIPECIMGFTEFRMQNALGMGFMVKLTPRGPDRDSMQANFPNQQRP